MEAVLLFCLIVVLVVRWLWIRERLERIENQLKEFAPTPVVAPPRPISPAPSPRPPALVAAPAMPPAPEPAAHAVHGRLGSDGRRQLAQQAGRADPGDRDRAGPGLLVHAGRTRRQGRDLARRQRVDAGRGRSARAARPLPYVRPRTAGRRMGRALLHGVRHARGRRARILDDASWRRAAGGGCRPG